MHASLALTVGKYMSEGLWHVILPKGQLKGDMTQWVHTQLCIETET